MFSHRTFAKDIIREIRATKNRFISIMAIVAIGVGFFSGVKTAKPNMTDTAQLFYKDQNLMDLNIKSTLGLTEEDAQALSALPGVKSIRLAYSADLLFISEGTEDSIAKVFSFDIHAAQSDVNYINMPKLREGRFPQAAGECVIDHTYFGRRNITVGSMISFYLEDDEIGDVLNITQFKVVGIAEMPMYISFERGTSSIGDGSADCFILLPSEAFAYEVYTDIFITFSASENMIFDDPQYKSFIEEMTERAELTGDIRRPARYEKVTGDALRELNEAQEKLDKAKKEYDDGKRKFDSEMSEAQRDLGKAKKEINDFEKLLRTLPGLYKTASEQYEAGLELYEKNAADFAAAEQMIISAEAVLYAMNEVILAAPEAKRILEDYILGIPADPSAEVWAMLENDITIGVLGDAGIIKGLSELSGEQSARELADKISQLSDGAQAFIDLNGQTAAESREQLEANRIQLSMAAQELSSAEAEIKQMKDLINTGPQTIAEARKEIRKGEEELDSGSAKARKELEEGLEKINDAQQEINDARKKVEDIKFPEWYILGRSDYPGFEEFISDIEKVDKIAAVFPVFFILVAALVCMTTMSRMVEEERSEIGTLKSLGYSNFAVSLKYIGYAFGASLAGSIAGLAAGFTVLPYVIFGAYRIIYVLPEMAFTVRWTLAVLCTVCAVLCTVLAALSVCSKELRSCPAELMRPKAPKTGKKILLEKISFLWNRLSFLSKVTMRNLFRYKKRVLMTVVGISGCTALILAGFGLQYAISSIVDRQYGEIFVYDILGIFDDKINEHEREVLSEYLSERDGVTDFMFTRQSSVDVDAGGSRKKEVYVFAADNPEIFGKFINLRERKDKTPLKLSDNGVIITEKLSKLLDIKPGGTIRVYFDKDNSADIPVIGIAENYVMNYIYFTQAGYEKFSGHPLVCNTFLMNYDKQSRSRLSTEILRNEDMIALSYSEDGGAQFRDLVKGLNYIVLVVIISAGLLAFVVLYNLASINVNERIRELATIKVLGFNDREVSAYINKENTISAVIGTACGLVMGVYLERFIVTTAEVDSVMFAPDINTFSFAVAAVLTLVFTAAVNTALHFRLRKIQMAESLKSVD